MLWQFTRDGVEVQFQVGVPEFGVKEWCLHLFGNSLNAGEGDFG